MVWYTLLLSSIFKSWILLFYSWFHNVTLAKLPSLAALIWSSFSNIHISISHKKRAHNKSTEATATYPHAQKRSASRSKRQLTAVPDMSEADGKWNQQQTMSSTNRADPCGLTRIIKYRTTPPLGHAENFESSTTRNVLRKNSRCPPQKTGRILYAIFALQSLLR